MSARSNQRAYLEVPFTEKDAARHLGARWDGNAQAWFVPVGVDPIPFLRWPRLRADPALNRPAPTSPGSFDPDNKLVAAKVLGRLGGIAGGHKGGLARAEALSPERRQEIAMMGVRARAAKRAQQLVRGEVSRSAAELRRRRGSEATAEPREENQPRDVAAPPRLNRIYNLCPGPRDESRSVKTLVLEEEARFRQAMEGGEANLGVGESWQEEGGRPSKPGDDDFSRTPDDEFDEQGYPGYGGWPQQG
jgi:hypothetical protein